MSEERQGKEMRRERRGDGEGRGVQELGKAAGVGYLTPRVRTERTAICN